MSASIYESLPPSVAGAMAGKLSMRIKRLSLRDGTFAVGYSARFQWWGGAAVQMACPWKAGMTETEAVFPIRAEASVLDAYLRDMHDLTIEVIDKAGKVVGKGTVNLHSLVGPGLQAPQLLVSLSSTKAGSKKTLGELQMSATTTWDRSPLEEGYFAPPQTDATPQRAERVPVAAEPNFGVSSFQRNEALTITDFSNRFSDWPTGGVGAAAAGTASNTNTNTNTNTATTTTTNTNTNTNVTSAKSDNCKATPRAPLAHAAAKKKADRAEKATEKSEPIQPQTATARASKEYDPSPYSAEGENTANSLRSDSKHAEVTKVDTTVGAILQKAESLLNLVRATKPPNSSSSSSSSSGNNNRSSSGSDNTRIRSATAAVDLAAPLMQLSEPRGRGRVGFGLSGMPTQRTWTLPEPGDISGSSDARGRVGSFATTSAEATYDLTQIEWLLRGLPDAYETEPEYSDEAIQGIIKQGGNPPSAILFPSIYSATQRVMDKLVKCNGLQVRIQHLLVFSARFGLRRDSSHFILRPPLGVTSSSEIGAAASAVEPLSHFIALPELDDEQQQPIYSDTAVRRKANKGLQRDYFVGGIDLHHDHCFPLYLTDKVVREWMEGGSDGCIQLVLYGYLFPPANTTKGHAFSDPVIFGTASIPLSGLLLSDSLDAIVTADLEADQSTLASVLGRARALPQGHALLASKPLGLTMGTVKLQLTLLSEGKAAEPRVEEKMESKIEDISSMTQVSWKRKPDRMKNSPLLQPLVSPVVQKEREEGGRPPNDPLHAAMMFHPQEARDSIAGSGNNPASIAVGVYCVEDILIRAPPQIAPGSLIVQYKAPTSSGNGTPTPPVTLSAPLHFSLPARHDGPCAVLSTLSPTLRLFDVSDLREWKPPVFEVWIDLNVGSGGQRILVGLARVPDSARLNEILHIDIVDVLGGTDTDAGVVGNLVVSLSAHPSHGAAEDMGHKLLSRFTAGRLQPERAGGIGIDTTGWGRRVDPLDTRPAPLAHVDSAMVDALAESELNPEADLGANLGIAVEGFCSQEGSLRSQIEGDDHVQLGDHMLRILGEAQEEDDENEDQEADKDVFSEENDDLVGVIALLNPTHPPIPKGRLPLPKGDAPRLYAPPAVEQPSPNTRLGLPYTHILEVSIEGSCANVEGSLTAAAPLGCYLVYRLDSPFMVLLEQSSSSDAKIADDGTAVKLASADRSNNTGQPRWSSVWWDGDCAVLNGRARHVFKLRGSTDIARPCFPQGLTMFVVQCDAEGNLPMSSDEEGEEDPPVVIDRILGVATVPSEVLEALFSQAGSRSVVDIRWDPVLHSVPVEAYGIERVVSVSLSHHVDPFSLRPSLPLANTELDGAAATGITAPPSLDFSAPIATAAVTPVRHASRGHTFGITVTIDTLFIRATISSTSGPTPFSVYVMCTSVARSAAESGFLPSVVGAECFVSNLRPLPAQGKVQWNEQYSLVMPYSSGAIGSDSSHQLAATPLRALRGAALQLSVYYRKAWRPSLSPLNGPAGSAGDGVQIGDYFLGSCVVDLSGLSYADSQGSVHGWYHVVDNTNKEIGQISLSAAVEASQVSSTLAKEYGAAAPSPSVTATAGSTEEIVGASETREEAADATKNRSAFLDYSSSFLENVLVAHDNTFEGVYSLDRTVESIHVTSLVPFPEGPYRLNVTNENENEIWGAEQEGEEEEEKEEEEVEEEEDEEEEDEEEEEEQEEQEQEEEEEEEEEEEQEVQEQKQKEEEGEEEEKKEEEEKDDNGSLNSVPSLSSWRSSDGCHETEENDSVANLALPVVTTDALLHQTADAVKKIELDKGHDHADSEVFSKCRMHKGDTGPSSAMLLGYMEGDDEWSVDENEIDGAPLYNEEASYESFSSLEDDGGSPPRQRTERPSPKAASSVSGLFASMIGSILQTNAVRSNALLVQRLAQGPGDSDEDDFADDDARDQCEEYAHDFLSYQGTDTDIGSVYTLDFEAGSLEAVDVAEDDSDEEDCLSVDSKQSKQESAYVNLTAPVVPALLPCITSCSPDISLNSSIIVTPRSVSAVRPNTGAYLHPASIISPAFVPTFWKRGTGEIADGCALPPVSVAGPILPLSFAMKEVPHIEMSNVEPDSPLTDKIKEIVHTEMEILRVASGHNRTEEAISNMESLPAPTPLVTSPISPPPATLNLEVSAVNARRGAWSRFPGKLDAETERVSRIMLGLQSKSSKRRI